MHRIAIVTATLLLATATTGASAGDPAAGEQKMEACTACHGENGTSEQDMYPVLAGQHESYLYHALRAYKTGDRTNAIMSGQVEPLSDQDMRDLAAYYADQDHEDSVTTPAVSRGSGLD